MAGSTEGSWKTAAQKWGLGVEEYRARREAGFKPCRSCSQWKPLAEYQRNSNSWDGCGFRCAACRLAISTPEEASLSPSERKRLRLRKAWETRRLTFVPPMKGKKMSDESRQKMSRSRRGKPSSKKGKKLTSEQRKKISEATRRHALRGPACPSYKDGRNAERRGLRETLEYKRWRFDVYSRDHFTCQVCGDSRGGNLNAHHIFSFAEHPELRLNLDNGITLCEACHERLHYKPDSIREMRKRCGLIRTLKFLRRKRDAAGSRCAG